MRYDLLSDVLNTDVLRMRLQAMSRGIQALVAVFALLAASLLGACSGDARPLIEEVEVRDLRIDSLDIVAPPNSILPLTVNPGERIAFTLRGVRADGSSVDVPSDERSWSVSDGGVASISEDGVFRARADGSARVSVAIGSVVASGFDITVSQSSVTEINDIRRTSMGDTVDPCRVATFSATGNFADTSERALSADLLDWEVIGVGVRTEEQSDGSVELIANTPGSLTLRALVGSVSRNLDVEVSASLMAPLTIGPGTLAGEVGDTQDLTATGIYSTGQGEPRTEVDITDAVDWSVTSGTEFISISNESPTRGRVSIESAGTAQITAECGVVSGVEEYIARDSDDDDDDDVDELSFEGAEGGRIQLPLTTAAFQLRVSTGSSYDSDDDITQSNDIVWQLGSFVGPAIIELDSTAPDVGRVFPRALGQATVQVTYRGESESVIVEVTN